MVYCLEEKYTKQEKRKKKIQHEQQITAIELIIKRRSILKKKRNIHTYIHVCNKLNMR